MNRHGGLLTRLKRLEKLHRPRRVPPLIIYALIDETPDAITGLTTLDRTVDRLYGEADWPAFAERARAACGGPRIMCATYAPEPAPVAAGEAPAPVFVPPPPDPDPRTAGWADWRKSKGY